MKERSITSRNILGGFCGGFLGIIACSIFQLLLPVGCVLGVVIGFWYQEIWAAMIEDYHKTCLRWQAFWENAIVSPRDKFWAYLARLKKSYEDNTGITELFYWVPRVGIGLARLLYKVLNFLRNIAMWPFKEPIHGVYIHTWTAAVCFVGFLVWLLAPVSLYFVYNFDNPRNNYSGGFGFNIFGFCALFLPVFCSIFQGLPNERLERVRQRDLARYNRHGFLYHIAYKFVEMVKHFALIVLWECLAFLYIVFGFIAVVLFMALPIVFAMWSVRVVWYFATKRQHWLCFSVTLVVTTASAILTRNHLHGVGLWIIAVATGCASGFVSELVRRKLEGILVAKPAVIEWASRKIEEPIGDFLVPIWKKYYSWTRKYMIDWIPVPFN